MLILDTWPDDSNHFIFHWCLTCIVYTSSLTHMGISKLPVSTICQYAMFATLFSKERRKQILKVIFISLLLDLVYRPSFPSTRIPLTLFFRSPSLSFCLCSPNFSSSTATKRLNSAHQIRFSIASFSDSIPTNNLSPVQSAIAMILFPWVVLLALCSPSSKLSRLHLSAFFRINMDGVRHFSGQWGGILLQSLCG